MRIDRLRQASNYQDLDRSDDDRQEGSAAFLAITADQGNYPNTATSVYAIHPVQVVADEVEGATPSFTANTSVWFHATNLGTNVPNTGTYVIVHGVGGRLAFRHDG